MINPTTHSRVCQTCDFTSFCSPEDKISPKSEHAINSLVKNHRSLKRNESLYLSNDKFYNLYAIKKGAIKTLQFDSNGNELIKGFYFAGEILGYEAIHSGQYPFSAVALCDTIVCEIPYKHLFESARPKPALIKQLLNLISQQLTSGSYLDMNTAEQRLAAFIIDLSTRLRTSGSSQDMILPMTREDMGNYLRLAAETISRILSKFQKDNIIEIHHKKIRLLNLKKLMEIADTRTTLCQSSN